MIIYLYYNYINMLSDKQMNLLRYKAKEAGLEVATLVVWIKQGKLSITEIMQGILWKKA